MVGQLELPALRVDGFRFRMVAGHEPQKIQDEVRMVVEPQVHLV